MEGKRVVVTGLGTVNPLGNDVESVWREALAGRSGIRAIKSFDASTYSCRVAGEVQDFDPFAAYTQKNVAKARNHLDFFVHFAVAATQQALSLSQLQITPENSGDIGVILGTGIGGMRVHTKQSGIFWGKGHRRISPFYIPSLIGNIAAGVVSMEQGLRGPNMSVQTACASSNHALAVAAQAIRTGEAKAMVCGGTEAIVEPLTVAGFCNMRALSTKYNDQPATSSRPFDKNRDGFVMGEGAAIFVLEELEHAKKRGAKIYAELLSVGMSADAYDMVAPCSDGSGAYLAMSRACQFAGIDPKDIDYINCHGTSTLVGDKAEISAVDRLFKSSTQKKDKHVWVGSTKSMTGHLIGAAAATEALFSVLALRDGKIPPNINIFEFDEDLSLGREFFSTEMVEKKDMNIVASNSFGFGGHNATVIFRSSKNI